MIIPCYNQGNYIKDAIDSVLNSDYENFEIIVINDGSTDSDTVKILSEISHPKIKIIHQENLGLPAARNNGIKIACGDYILPLDADDKIHAKYIRKAAEILDNNPDIGLVYCDYQTFGSETRLSIMSDYKGFARLLVKNNFVVTSMFRKNDFIKVGGYKDEMKDGLEDWEFWITLCEKGIKPYKIPETMFFYRKYGSHTMSGKFENKEFYWQSYKKILKLHSDSFIENIEKITPYLFLYFMGVAYLEFDSDNYYNLIPHIFLQTMNKMNMDVKVTFAKIFIFRALKFKNLFRTLRKMFAEKVNIFKCLIKNEF